MTWNTDKIHRLQNGKIQHHASINQFHKSTRTKLTVAELTEWLKQWPPDATATGYEGEGGTWICVDWETAE